MSVSAEVSSKVVPHYEVTDLQFNDLNINNNKSPSLNNQNNNNQNHGGGGYGRGGRGNFQKNKPFGNGQAAVKQDGAGQQ